MAVDSAGNVYLADTWNDTIRKVTPEGAVTTLAGLAISAGSTDGTGSAARFRNPTGVAVDGAGNVYVADRLNCTIRKVTAEGVVTTLAGWPGSGGRDDGVGSAARFSGPAGVAVNSLGYDVYVADTDNHTIREVSGRLVTTMAGLARSPGSVDGWGSAARFYNPMGVAVDSADNVYVADNHNCTIRKLTPWGYVTTLAGSGVPGSTDGTGIAARFSYPCGLAVNSAGNIYVADTGGHRIRKVTPSGEVTTLAGAWPPGSSDGIGSAARFYDPTGVAVDSAGNVYVADRGNHTIRKVTPARVVTTIGGTPGSAGGVDGMGCSASFSSPWGIALDSAGNLYVADSENNRISKGTPIPALPGDINGDGYVNVGDLQLLVAAWDGTNTTTPPSGNWNADADLNSDRYVNVGDLQLLVANWGESGN